MTPALTSYGPAWVARKAAYFQTHPARCAVCNRAWPKHRLEVHHIYGASRLYPLGAEPDNALVALCDRCHDGHPTSVHSRHRAHSRRRGWMRGFTVTNPDRHYATLPKFTRRALRWRWFFCWRAMFVWQPDLPEIAS